MKEITNPYGLTESGPVMTMTRYFEPSIERKCQTIGQALPGVEVAIIDPETQELAPIGQDGEICCRGFNNMKGYYKMPEQTAKCIDKNGWLHSGDIGRMDKDGYYYITGRLKDLIIRGGENISPKEVEDFLGTMPGVKDVAVVGCPSKKYGEQPAAFVIPADGATIKRPLPRRLPDDRLAEDPEVQAPRDGPRALARRLRSSCRRLIALSRLRRG